MSKAPRFRTNNEGMKIALDALADHIDSLPSGKKIIAGENIRKYENAHEIVLHGTPSGMGGGGGLVDCKCSFDHSYTKKEGADTYDFNIGYGMINGNLVDKMDDLETGIDPEDEDPTPKYVYIDVTLSSMGGMSNATYSVKSSVQDAVTPEANSIPTSISVIHGVIFGLRYFRLLPCTGISVYPIILCVSTSSDSLEKYYSIEVSGA
jgi:hypothetical protein